jgi:plastocyanin
MRVTTRSFSVRRTLALLMLVGSGATATSCFNERNSGDEGTIAPTPDPDGVVEIRLTSNNLRFEPGDIVIPRCTTVRWTNAAGFHTINPDNPSQSGGWTRRAVNGAGETFTHTFNTAGQTYRYQLRAAPVGRKRRNYRHRL